jgi:hypothetical protein
MHRHKYEIADVRHMRRTAAGCGSGEFTEFTLITRRCAKCRKFRQTELRGHIPEDIVKEEK